jgi:hypothetical protein
MHNPATNKETGQFESWAKYKNAIETTPTSSVMLGGSLKLVKGLRLISVSGSIINDGIRDAIDGSSIGRSANAVKTDDVVPSVKPTTMYP